MHHPVLSLAEDELGCPLRTQGNLDLLEGPRRALLISRGERNPTPAAPWIRGVRDATKTLISEGETLVTGTDRVAWDLALLTCKDVFGRAIVALECADGLGVEKEILPENALLVWPKFDRYERIAKPQRLLRRDRLMALLANCAYAIRVRAGGNMRAAADSLHQRGCPVKPWLDSVDEAGAEAVQPEILRKEYKPGVFSDRSFAGYLTHFTREPAGAWPGESRADWLRWLGSGPRFEARDAFAAVRRILTERRIYSCGRLIPSGTPMVCFTAQEPRTMLGQRRWRKGLRRWSFSSYAVSFLADDLRHFDARPVRYAARQQIESSARDERCFMQVAESSGEAWQREAEWRVKGDLEFRHISNERIVALVSNAEEAAAIEHEFGIQALVMTQC